MVKEIKENEFSDVIKEGKVVIDCFATWCGPCKMMGPIFEQVSNEEKDVKFYKLDVDDAEDVARQYGIMSIPTLLLFEDGELKNKSVGLKSKDEIIDLIK